MRCFGLVLLIAFVGCTKQFDASNELRSQINAKLSTNLAYTSLASFENEPTGITDEGIEGTEETYLTGLRGRMLYRSRHRIECRNGFCQIVPAVESVVIEAPVETAEAEIEVDESPSDNIVMVGNYGSHGAAYGSYTAHNTYGSHGNGYGAYGTYRMKSKETVHVRRSGVFGRMRDRWRMRRSVRVHAVGCG